MKKRGLLSRWFILLAVVIAILTSLVLGFTQAAFNDIETSGASTATAWASTQWTQTLQGDFNNGVLNNTDTASSPGNVNISIVPNPTLITSNNTEVSTSTGGETWELIKTLTFTKNGSSYNTLRIDTTLKSLNSYDTVNSSIRLNDTEIFNHSTSSTTYVTYNDNFDFSSYADGDYTLKLYLQVTGGTGYNNLFAVYKTSPVLVASNNTEVSATGSTNWQLKKTLNFTKDSSAYDTLSFDTSLRSQSSGRTASYRIDVDGVQVFTGSTTSTTYVTFTDILDFSGYANGPHTVELYLMISHRNWTAYNSLFEIYRSSPELITSDNTEKTVTLGSGSYQLMKTLLFTKNGPTYDELRVDTNLHATNPASANISIRINDVEMATHGTSNTTYVGFSDTIDVSSLADGNTYTIKVYLMSSTSSKAAFNSLFEVYRTKTYAASGTLASQVLDTNITGSRWDGLVWDRTLLAGTNITFEVRASDTSFLKTDATPSWTSVGDTSPVISGLPSGRYQQWRATLSTANVTQTPVLNEARVYYYGG